MTKRRTFQPAKLRDRRSGISPYLRHGKTERKYPVRHCQDDECRSPRLGAYVDGSPTRCLECDHRWTKKGQAP